MQSEPLTRFYNRYKFWLERGAPHRQPFSRRRGLCSSVEEYLGDTHSAYFEMVQQFRDAKLCINFPFNNGSHINYSNETDLEQIHLNMLRVQWVLDHAE